MSMNKPESNDIIVLAAMVSFVLLMIGILFSIVELIVGW